MQTTSVTRASHPAWGTGDHSLICACTSSESYEGSGPGSGTVIDAGRKERESVQCIGQWGWSGHLISAF